VDALLPYWEASWARRCDAVKTCNMEALHTAGAGQLMLARLVHTCNPTCDL
jgi:hypothetical protein